MSTDVSKRSINIIRVQYLVKADLRKEERDLWFRPALLAYLGNSARGTIHEGIVAAWPCWWVPAPVPEPTLWARPSPPENPTGCPLEAPKFQVPYR